MRKPSWMFLVAAAIAAGSVTTSSSLRADDPAPPPAAAPADEPDYFRGTIRVTEENGNVKEYKFGTGEEAQMDAKLKELDATQGRIETSRAYGSRPDGTVPELPEIASPMYGIGVTISSNVPQVLRRHLKLEENEGLVIQSVAADSPAAKAGLEVGDVLVQTGEAPINAHKGLVDAVQAAGKEKQPLSLTAIVAGERKTIEVTPVETDTIEWTFRDIDTLFGRPTFDRPGMPNNAESLFQRVPPGSGPRAPFRRPFSPNTPSLERRIQELEESVEQLKQQQQQP